MSTPARSAHLDAGESYIEDVPSETPATRSPSGSFPTLRFAELSRCDAVIIAVPTPLTRNREPDLGPLLARHRGASPTVLQRGQLVVLESTTYPGTTRERLVPLLEESGLAAGHGLQPRLLARAHRPGPHRLHDAQHAQGRGRPDRRLPGARRRRSTRRSATRSCACLDARGRRAHEAARERLPLGEHRARQRAGDALRPHGHRHLGGRRRGLDQALRLHALRARARAWAATACPVDPFYLSWRAREFGSPTDFIELAGEVNQAMPRFCAEKVARALNEHAKPVRGSRVAILGVSYKAGVGDLRESPALKIMHLLGEPGRRARLPRRLRGRARTSSACEPSRSRTCSSAATWR